MILLLLIKSSHLKRTLGSMDSFIVICLHVPDYVKGDNGRLNLFGIKIIFFNFATLLVSIIKLYSLKKYVLFPKYLTYHEVY